MAMLLAASVTPLRDGGAALDEDAIAPMVDFLAAGGVEGLFACIDAALGDGPRAFVAARPVGAARMGEQHLERIAPAAIQEDAGAGGLVRVRGATSSCR